MGKSEKHNMDDSRGIPPFFMETLWKPYDGNLQMINMSYPYV